MKSLTPSETYSLDQWEEMFGTIPLKLVQKDMVMSQEGEVTLRQPTRMKFKISRFWQGAKKILAHSKKTSSDRIKNPNLAWQLKAQFRVLQSGLK